MNENWRPLFNEYDGSSLALDRHDDDWLIWILQVHPGWRVDFQTEETVFFVRADAASTRDVYAPGAYPAPAYL